MRVPILVIVLLALFGLLTFCTADRDEADASSPFLNQSDTVQYVGMEKCMLCHADKHATFIHTGMGMSFDRASREKSAALFDAHALVYDSVLNYYYKPFWRNDSLHIMEFRLQGKDTIHKRIETIDYIIGSGQHTNSHLLQINGYLYQAPITFYTQKQKWDMAPGMEAGFSSRFSRMIEAECMTCHNGLPKLVAGSVNKYEKIPTGIDCERCHGPGSLHVAQVSKGILVDTATEIDYAIVNPRHLSVELQNELCMRCHLQGVNVLNNDASFAAFKPGDRIREHWNVFLPQYEGGKGAFLMASQADRMLQSKCYLNTKAMSCITCHNPHLSVKETPRAVFNAPCIQCHSTQHQCTVAEQDAMQVKNDCSSCHIPRSGSVDIPHVSISDHKIQIPGKADEQGTAVFKGLQCLTDPSPAPLTMARGYLHYYESFNKDRSLLDSAAFYLLISDAPDDEIRTVTIHLDFLKDDLKHIIILSEDMSPERLDAWTAYRIGEAHTAYANHAVAATYFARAAALFPLHPDFVFKLATAYQLQNKTQLAEPIFRDLLKENPRYEKAWNNLAVILFQQGKNSEAVTCLNTAMALDPDYTSPRVQLAEYYLRSRQKTEAREVIEYLEQNHPDLRELKMLQDRYRKL